MNLINNIIKIIKLFFNKFFFSKKMTLFPNSFLFCIMFILFSLFLLIDFLFSFNLILASFIYSFPLYSLLSLLSLILKIFIFDSLKLS